MSDARITAHRTPVTFTNRSGLRLFGILHEPAKRSTDLAIVLLSPGVKMRVGPQGIYNRMADRFVELGIPVLRFDFFGLGDSDGALTEELLRDVYNHIEVGRFVDDTIDSMDWMQQKCGSRRFILSGLCGGAITGLLAGGRDRRVAGLLGLGITPVLASRAANPAKYMTSGQLREMGQAYLSKLTSPGAWLRLLTFQSDFNLIRRAVLEPFARKVTSSVGTAPATPPLAEDDNANPLFPSAFFEMLRSKRPMLLVFGGSDRLRWEYEEKFVARHSQTLAQLPSLWEVHVIEQANHVLSLNEWQEEMLDRSDAWLRRHFAGDVATEAGPRPRHLREVSMPAIHVTSALERR